MKTKFLRIAVVALGLACGLAREAAAEDISVKTVAVEATGEATAFGFEIPEGWAFTVGLAGASSSSDWNSVSVDLQVQIAGEWITLTDFDNVTAAKVILVEMAPGKDWRFDVSSGTTPDLIAEVVIKNPKER